MATARRARAGAQSGRRAYWQRHVEAHQRSGLTQAAFCAQHGLRTGTLSFWKWKLAREARVVARVDATGPRRTTSTSPFIPIHLAAVPTIPDAAAIAATPDGLEIELTVGPTACARVRGCVDPGWLVQVLRGLADPAC